MPYVIEDRDSHQVLSRHRTRQGAIDAWRLRHTGHAVQIYRAAAHGARTLVVEGTWYEAKRR